MANFNLVVNTSNFKPFDIGTSLLVLRDYRDAYYQMENKLEKLLDEQGNIVLPEDSKYKKTFDSYTEDFNDFATRFSKGMTRKSASDWATIRNRYRKEIKPIKDAVDAYNLYVDKWDAISTSDDTAIRGHNYSVDDFYGGNRPDIGYRSGKRIEADAIGYFTGVSNALTQDPTFKTILEDQYHQITTTPGLNSSDALNAALIQYNQVTGGQHSKLINDILSHMQNLFNNLGVENFTEEAKQQVWNRISSGLIKSIQAPQSQRILNLNFESDVARSTRLNNESRANESHRLNMLQAQLQYSTLAFSMNEKGEINPNLITKKIKLDGQKEDSYKTLTLTDGSEYILKADGKYYLIKDTKGKKTTSPIGITKDLLYLADVRYISNILKLQEYEQKSLPSREKFIKELNEKEVAFLPLYFNLWGPGEGNDSSFDWNNASSFNENDAAGDKEYGIEDFEPDVWEKIVNRIHLNPNYADVLDDEIVVYRDNDVFNDDNFKVVIRYNKDNRIKQNQSTFDPNKFL